jgi:hypothetical protein
MNGGSRADYVSMLHQAHKQRLIRMGAMPYGRNNDTSLCRPAIKPAKPSCAGKIRAKRVYHREPGPKMNALLFPVSIPSHPVVDPKQFCGDAANAPSLQEIMDGICNRYGLDADEIRQVKGRRYVKLAKHEFCWRAWHETPCVVTRIARFLETDNHALVSRGICTHQVRLDRGLL